MRARLTNVQVFALFGRPCWFRVAPPCVSDGVLPAACASLDCIPWGVTRVAWEGLTAQREWYIMCCMHPRTRLLTLSQFAQATQIICKHPKDSLSLPTRKPWHLAWPRLWWVNMTQKAMYLLPGQARCCPANIWPGSVGVVGWVCRGEGGGACRPFHRLENAFQVIWTHLRMVHVGWRVARQSFMQIISCSRRYIFYLGPQSITHQGRSRPLWQFLLRWCTKISVAHFPSNSCEVGPTHGDFLMYSWRVTSVHWNTLGETLIDSYSIDDAVCAGRTTTKALSFDPTLCLSRKLAVEPGSYWQLIISYKWTHGQWPSLPLPSPVQPALNWWPYKVGASRGWIRPTLSMIGLLPEASTKTLMWGSLPYVLYIASVCCSPPLWR